MAGISKDERARRRAEQEALASDTHGLVVTAPDVVDEVVDEASEAVGAIAQMTAASREGRHDPVYHAMIESALIRLHALRDALRALDIGGAAGQIKSLL